MECAAAQAAKRKEQTTMQPTFFITPEGILGAAEPAAELPSGALRFSTEQELANMAQHWPLRRLVQLWNSLPGMRLVQRFEDKDIAVARLWRALQPEAQHHRREPSPTAPKRKGLRTPPSLPRPNSKAAEILSLLGRPEGATVQELMAATGWQAHSVRGFISGNLVKKRKLKLGSLQRDGQHAYHLPPVSRSSA
jgi:hypothetical protein